ncbi:MAG: aspartate carbamoyltransferase catalytic subunit [Rhodopirellula sp. JB044]|uniref:aspartate carbamoyltransferase catalytic subunit n=1 Tax=Rhodopirellula sp. JB044 TaxID=3342844 RepID=UPI00370CBCF0
MDTMTEAPPLTFPAIWRHQNLLDLERLRSDELQAILATAQTLKDLTDGCRRKLSLLSGKTCANLFFENSTRTRNSFSLAAKRLGADTVEFSSSGSSVAKGETFVDTAKTIEAMGVDWVVTRHHTPGTPHLLARELQCSVLNAGDGPHEHPTQGLLDILTILQNRGPANWMDPAVNASELLSGMTIAMVGDIAHSRTARSNIWGLKALGAHVIICGPPTLVSHRWEEIGFEVAHRLDDIVQRCDVLNLLRIQFERQYTRPFPSVREYAALYAMNGDRMRRAKEDILIMAPGPINRGVEITPEVADGPHSVILEQVTNGIAVRMAALWLLAGAHERASS